MKINLKNIPESLDECSLSQAQKILEINDLCADNDDRQTQVFFVLIARKSSVYQTLKIFISSLFYKHVFDVSELKFEITDIVQLIDQNIEIFTQKIKTFPFEKSAGDYFENMNFNQFRQADAQYYIIIQHLETTGELFITDDFIYALFDLRFFKARIKKYKLLIFHYYSSNRQQLALEFPEVFNPKKRKNADDVTYTEMWENMLNAVAEKPQFYDTVDGLNIRYVLKYINETIKASDKLAENTPK